MTTFHLLLPILLATCTLWSGSPVCLADESPVPTCKAATPVPNPWTKRLPQGWWKQRHEDILAAPGRKECELIFIGDSITDGWDHEGAGLKIWEREFVPLKVLNLGINCDSTQHVLWRLDNGEIDGLPKLKVAVVMIGVNNKGITRDKPEEIARGIEAICERLKTKVPHAKILLMGVFPRFFGKDNNDDVNGSISKLHDGERIFYLNINEQLLKTEGAIKDRVGHVTEKGYEVWAEAIRPTLKKLMTEDARETVKTGPGAKSGDDRPPGGNGAMFFRVFVSRNDQNGDGLVEKSEFRGSGDRFDQMDTNKNGRLDRAEIDELHRSRMADPLSMRQRIAGGEARRPPVDLPATPSGHALPPGDGAATNERDEPFAVTPLGTRITAKQAFARLDADADGKVTAAEFERSPGMADPRQALEVVEKVDRDGDGALSFEEFNTVFAKRHAKPAPATPAGNAGS